MHVCIIYAHPSENSFTAKVRDAFIKGLVSAGHSYVVSDLYKKQFDSTFSETDYLREAFYDRSKPVPADILGEQEEINRADALAFIYPVFWTEAPEKLVGWFQRVWTYGFAYGEARSMKQLRKVLFLVTMGGSLKDPVRRTQIEAMKTVMLGDRIGNRAKESTFLVFDEMTRGFGNEERRIRNLSCFLKEAFALGAGIE